MDELIIALNKMSCKPLLELTYRNFDEVKLVGIMGMLERVIGIELSNQVIERKQES